MDFTVNGSNSYRPLTFTEKVFTDDWAKKFSTANHRKEPVAAVQPQGLFFTHIDLGEFDDYL